MDTEAHNTAADNLIEEAQRETQSAKPAKRLVHNIQLATTICRFTVACHLILELYLLIDIM